MKKPTKKDIGKKVTFKIGSCNWNPRKETRIIKDVKDRYVVVKYVGTPDFLVKFSEIINIKK